MAVNNLDFTSKVTDWVAQTEQRMTVVFKEATQRTVAIAQDRIPVDTGYARASVRASTESMPPIESGSKNETGAPVGYDPGAVTTVIASAHLGQTIFVGWSASYVQYLEFGHSKQAPSGFVGLAALQWNATVSQVCEELKSRVAARA